MSDWRIDLDDFFARQERLEQAEAEKRREERREVETFISQTVVPALEQLQDHLAKHGRDVRIAAGDGQATITVLRQGNPEIIYRIYAHIPQPAVEYAFISRDTGKAVKASDAITAAGEPVPIGKITQETIITHFIRKYKSVAS